MGHSAGAISQLTKREFDQRLKQATSAFDFMARLGVSGEGVKLGLIARLVECQSDVSHWVNDPRKDLARLYLKTHDKRVRKSRPVGYNVAYDYVRPGNNCEICGQGPIWNGKPTLFEIDHINGDAWDCNIENLRRICPNCHRQQSTSSGYAKVFATAC